MKKILLLTVLICLQSMAFAQNKTGAQKLVDEGIELHDKGDYTGSIAKYDQALLLDKDNFDALSEKAYSLNSLQKYDEAIICCKKVIAVHGAESDLGTVYVTYGNSLDALKKPEEAIKIYDEGIKRFPDLYQLYFNKGITLIGLNKYDESVLCFQKAILKNPSHAGSHNALTVVLGIQHKNIPSLLASCRFLAIEPQSSRSVRNLDNIKSITAGNVEKNGKGGMTIRIDSGILGDTTVSGEPKANNFSMVELIMAMSPANLVNDKKTLKLTEPEKFAMTFNAVCASMKEESKKNNTGFYWTYYAPYFIAMKDKELVTTFSYIAFASSDDKTVKKWIDAHPAEIKAFYVWDEAYVWPTK